MSARPNALRLGTRSRITLAGALTVGSVGFLWPFVAAPGAFGDTSTAPLLFGAIVALVVAVGVVEVAEGGIDAKAIAMLGVLSALGAVLRPLGAGTAGIETVFFCLVVAGRVFGPGFGFMLGCTTIFASALLTGGVGPWMPYQMFACALVGLGAGMLPRAKGRVEVAMLALYGAVSAYVTGFALNLSFWPFTVDPHSTISYLPGAAVSTNLVHYIAFDAATSLGWDTARAITNFVLLLAVGPALLATLRRAARRAAFEAPVDFVPSATLGAGPSEGTGQLGARP